MGTNRNKARHADMRVEIYDSLEGALALDRGSLIDIQNFESDMTGLLGLEALDGGNDFEDGELIEEPCYIVVRRNVGKRKVEGRKVKTRSIHGATDAGNVEL